jgi:hypothetical protein
VLFDQHALVSTRGNDQQAHDLAPPLRGVA